PHHDHAGQGKRRCQASARPSLAHANFFVDQGKQQWNNQSQKQQKPHDRLRNEDDVPRIPLLGERPEGAHAVVIGEVEQDVAEARKASVEEQESPARRQVGILGSAAAQTPEQIDEAEDYLRYQRDAEKRVGEAAMMGKSEDRAADETAED